MNRSFAILAAALMAVPLVAGTTRPVRDDVGFCWSPASMARLVEYLDADDADPFPGEGLVAAISPHDDYLYAGRIYHPLFKALRAREVVIFGVTHGAVRKEIGDPRGVAHPRRIRRLPGIGETGRGLGAPGSASRPAWTRTCSWSTTRPMSSNIPSKPSFPFLQYYNPDVKITPIMVAPMPYARMEEVAANWPPLSRITS